MNYTALAWDDQAEQYLELLADELLDYGIKVEIEKTVEVFLEKMKTGEYDLFITDLAFRGESEDEDNPYIGFANLTEIRKIHTRKPVLILTGFGIKAYKFFKTLNDPYCWLEDKSTLAAFLATKIVDKLQNVVQLIAENEMPEPRIFIGAAGEEAMEIAREIQNNLLKRNIHVAVWDDDLFEPGNSILENLDMILDEYNAGIFVFHPSDIIKVKNKEQFAVRDNVIFEFGLFVGRWGLKRTTVVIQEGVDMRTLSDLEGLVYEKYKSPKNAKDLGVNLAGVCTRIVKRYRPKQK